MKNTENFTIVNKSSNNHYDTNDERFYSESWDKTFDSKKYLDGLINSYPEKFEGCEIQETK